MKKIIFLLFFLFPNFAFALVSTDVVNGCEYPTLYIDNNKHSSLIAVFTTNQYECQQGYFLPANVPGCRPCPSGFTCNGGTFTFNKTTAQGIKGSPLIDTNVSSVPNICSSHIEVTAQFTPNIINLNWYSVGDTLYETNTCTYGQPITLPATNPTRPGYTFVGWRLRTNN